MIANYQEKQKKARLGKKSMADYLIRASVDKQMDVRLKEHEQNVWKEVMAYAAAVDATLLLTLHKAEKMGKKKLRHIYEELIRTRVAYRLFYRDGMQYEERITGKNAEDEAIVKELLAIGVDIKAWEAEDIVIDDETGEVQFIKREDVQ